MCRSIVSRVIILMVLSLYLKGWQFDSLAVVLPRPVSIVPQNRCGLTMKVGTQYLLDISSALLKI